MNRLTWSDTEEVAGALYDRFPDLHPLTVRFTDLIDWILEIEGFQGDRKDCSEGVLEAVQMAWLDEYKFDH